MRNGSKVADELYIQRVLLVLEDFLFFSHCSFSCIAKQVATLKQLRLLSCLDLLETNLEHLVLFSDITFVLPISPTPDPARYIRTSPYNIVPDIECACIPQQGVSIVPNLALFLVGFT